MVDKTTTLALHSLYPLHHSGRLDSDLPALALPAKIELIPKQEHGQLLTLINHYIMVSLQSMSYCAQCKEAKDVRSYMTTTASILSM
jgi:hypothetical protein